MDRCRAETYWCYRPPNADNPLYAAKQNQFRSDNLESHRSRLVLAGSIVSPRFSGRCSCVALTADAAWGGPQSIVSLWYVQGSQNQDDKELASVTGGKQRKDRSAVSRNGNSQFYFAWQNWRYTREFAAVEGQCPNKPRKNTGSSESNAWKQGKLVQWKNHHHMGGFAHSFRTILEWANGTNFTTSVVIEVSAYRKSLLT